MDRRKALVVEDASDIRLLLCETLRQAGFEAIGAGTAAQCLKMADSLQPDLVTLDLSLPDMDGIEVCRQLRASTNAYIIMLTARAEETDRLIGLEMGADDYMVKPFTSAHLDARLTSVLRRAGRASRDEPTVIDAGALRVDLGQRQAYLDEQPLTLTRKEFDLLAYLAARPGRVVSRRELLEEVWRQPSVGEDQTIDVHLYWLRRKLGESAAKPRYLHTVRGVGFKFAAPD